MVSFFKKQNYLFMLAGAVLGLLLSVFVLKDWIAGFGGFARYIYMAFPVFLGIALGRIVSAFWASKRLKTITDMLYRQADPDGFLKVYEPMCERIPNNIVDYVDGMAKIAYAYEAKGDYDKALDILSGLRAEDLEIHRLAATSVVAVQRTRLYLLKRDFEKTEICLSDLQQLKDTCEKRAPQLQANLQNCIKLYSEWNAVLQNQNADLAYLKEEEAYATNPIHKGEILILLAEAAENSADRTQAETYYKQAASLSKQLYTTELAEKKLQELNS